MRNFLCRNAQNEAGSLRKKSRAVITHNEHISSEKIRFVNINPVELVKRLKGKNGKDVWICGGADLVQQLVNEEFANLFVCKSQ